MYAFFNHENIFLVIEHDGSEISKIKFISEETYWQHQALELMDRYTNRIKEALAEYFAGENALLDLKYRLEGSEFDLKVWEATKQIPYGKTATYSEIAQRIGNPNAAQAVGNALSKNPLVILIPCHRVVGSDGELHGFAGGLEIKQWLLDNEAKLSGAM